MFFNTLAFAIPALSVVAASSHQSQHGHHSASVKSKKAEIDARLIREGNAATFDVEKRQASNARFTYYDTSVGLGACGNYNGNDVWTVALNSDQLSAAGGYSSYPPSVCGKSITITYGGKTAVATIQDECPTCPYGGLDLSPSLFTYFADESVGVIYGTWAYGSGSSSPTTTSTTTTWTPTTTSTTWSPSPTTTSTSTYTPPTTTWTPTTSSTPAYTPPTSSAVPTTSTWVAETTSSSSVQTSSSSAVVLPSSSSVSLGVSTGASISASASSSAVSSVVGEAEESSAASAASSASASASASTSSSASTSAGGVTGSNIEKLGQLVSNLGGAICAGNEQCA